MLAGIEKGRPFLKSADDNFRIEFGGRLQSDFDAAESGTRTLTGQFLGSQFLIRRARIDVDAIFYKWIRAKIQAELTEGVSLKDAYIDLTFMPELRFRAGQFHVPFSLEELTSDNFIDFIERSIVNALAPIAGSRRKDLWRPRPHGRDRQLSPGRFQRHWRGYL